MPLARGGERSVAHAYRKALSLVCELVYVEDQYLWSHDVAEEFVTALRERPGLRLVAVIPHHPDSDGLTARMQLAGRRRAFERLREAAPGRVAVYGIENEAGTPIYVHAKVSVMDDQWLSVGSDNVNRRSWTHDSEMSVAVVEEGGDHNPFARAMRLRLAAEHLGRDVTPQTLLDVMADCVSPDGMWDAYAADAARVQAWVDGGRVGPRPAGRLRPVTEPEMGRLLRWVLTWPYRLVADPDGRPPRLRRQGEF